MTEETHSLYLPTIDDKAEIKDEYTTSLQFLNDIIAQWPTMTGAEKQTWLANNFDVVLRIIRAMLRMFGKLLS